MMERDKKSRSPKSSPRGWLGAVVWWGRRLSEQKVSGSIPEKNGAPDWS